MRSIEIFVGDILEIFDVWLIEVGLICESFCFVFVESLSIWL